MEPDFEVTPLACFKAAELMSKLKTPVAGLRVAVAAAGCNGFTYKVDWVDAAHIFDDDKVFYFGQLKIIIDPKSFPYLKGTTMDWNIDLICHGFRFDNPNAKTKCGCGTSFDV